MRSSVSLPKNWRAPVLDDDASRIGRIAWAVQNQRREASEILDPTQVKLPGLVLNG